MSKWAFGKIKLSLPVNNLILDLLDEELGDGGGREDHVSLRNSRAERELGDGSVLGVDILEVNHHHLVVIDHGLVPRTGLGDVVVQDTERGRHQLSIVFSSSENENILSS